ncbi:MAG: hypothetical protein ABW200_08440 [Hyphomicrobiaceae bacterium]
MICSNVKAQAALCSALALTMAGTAVDAAPPPQGPKVESPAQCGVGDTPEPNIQGNVPAGLTSWSFNCGVRLVGQLPRVGSVQGYGTCAYVREKSTVYVVDVSNPAKPVEVGSVPVKWGSETMRVRIAADRAVLVSGSSVYDIRDCLHPVLKGEINWPPLSIGTNPPSGGGGGTGLLPHDLRISHDATKVYGSLGLWQVDISNLDDPGTWKVTDLRCEILAQVPGPWQEPHRAALQAHASLCDDVANPQGGAWRIGGSNTQTAVLWGQLSHGIDDSADRKRVFIADQAGGLIGKLEGNEPKLHVIDVSQRPVKVLAEIAGPGHSMDWFRAGGREYVLHANEIGSAGFGGLRGLPGQVPADLSPEQAAVAARRAATIGNPVNATSDTCRPYPRPTALGWAFDAIMTDVSQPTKPRDVARLRIAVNDPESCAARKASGRDPSVAYHLIDDSLNAHFAAVNFGSAGLRIFDIRNPARAQEVAYFNHGPLVHGGVGYYDAARGLIYAAGSSGFWVLELEPQVRAKLGL